MAGDFSGMAAHWRAMGELAAAARTPSDPKDSRIQELTEQLRHAKEQLSLSEGRLKNREESLDHANALVDNQAAQIVDLNAKAAVGTPSGGRDEVLLRRLQRIEAGLRLSLERAEARAAQFQATLAVNGIDLPNEAAYFRKDGTDASYS